MTGDPARREPAAPGPLDREPVRTGEPTAPAIEVAGVGRTFTRGRRLPWQPWTGTTALDDVSFRVESGSRCGVVGESGSGKTTLVNLIAGLDTPTSGRVLIDGIDITGQPESRLGWLRRRLQVVFQDPMGSLDPRMRVADIVAEPLPDRRTTGAREQVAVALEQVGLDRAALRRYPHQFSGGQRQRISIARAVVGDPAILIADEAVSALDILVRADILELLDRLAARRSLTLLFVSHDLSVVRRVCDRVVVLQAGRVVEAGPTEQVYTDPQAPYTRELLAAVPTLARSLAAARQRAAGSEPTGADGHRSAVPVGDDDRVRGEAR